MFTKRTAAFLLSLAVAAAANGKDDTTGKEKATSKRTATQKKAKSPPVRRFET
ncbi:MAG TPA: hypothetical protein VFB08_02290 [Burkholderiales bacterium]|nr:hypothetical protein [Burkholderiales bacterium]